MPEAVAVAGAMVALGWLLCGVEGRDPVLHRVGGGKYTWAPNVNFTDWSIHEHFYVGDWLCKFFSFFTLSETDQVCSSPLSCGQSEHSLVNKTCITFL